MKSNGSILDKLNSISQRNSFPSVFLQIVAFKQRTPLLSHGFLTCMRACLPHIIRLFTAILLFIIPSILQAGTIEIEWDPPLTGEVAGYKIYYGTASGSYEWIQDVGAVTSYILTDLDDCREYFWAIKAYSPSGLESSTFSNEVSGMSRPRIESVEPASGEQGQIINLLIRGANYSASALLESNNPGIKLISTSQLNCNEVSASIQIDPQSRGMKPAPLGAYDITLVNPDRVFGTTEDVFTITLNKARIDIDLSGRIDGLDLNRLALIFGVSEADGMYNPDCDFDGNGWIDGDDLAYLAAYFGLNLQ